MFSVYAIHKQVWIICVRQSFNAFRSACWLDNIAFYGNLFDFHVTLNCCAGLAPSLSLFHSLSAWWSGRIPPLSFTSSSGWFHLFRRNNELNVWYLVGIGHQIQFGYIDNHEKIKWLRFAIDRTNNLTCRWQFATRSLLRPFTSTENDVRIINNIMCCLALSLVLKAFCWALASNDSKCIMHQMYVHGAPFWLPVRVAWCGNNKWFAHGLLSNCLCQTIELTYDCSRIHIFFQPFLAFLFK